MINIGIKTYQYPSGNKFFYLTINGIQFGSVMFSMREAEEAKAKILRGESL